MFLKGLLHAKEEMLCLGTAGKIIFLLLIMSLHGEEGSPCTSIFKAMLLSCPAFTQRNDLHSFWPQGQLKQLSPPLLPCDAYFHPQNTPFSGARTAVLWGWMLGLIRQLSPVKNKPAKKCCLKNAGARAPFFWSNSTSYSIASLL